MPNDRRSERRFRAAHGGIWIVFSFISLLMAINVDWIPGTIALTTLMLMCIFLALRKLVKPGGHPILVYHSISENQNWLPWSSEIAIRPETLDQHLNFLKRCGFRIISMDEWIAGRTHQTLTTRDLAIHFDDGYLDNWVAAAPILKRHQAPATIFVSLDFLSSESILRPTLETGQLSSADIQWPGYMSWEEARALDATNLIDIQPHGVDHARVPISARIIETITRENWRSLVWVQWRNMPGNKAEWWQHNEPPAIGYGSPVPESAPALSEKAWLGQRTETDNEFAERVCSDLRRCKDVFQNHLGKTPTIFCWPENGTNTRARQIASELGFIATTGGINENRFEEPDEIISRLHVGDYCLGFRSPLADLFYLYASIRCFQGFYYWYYLLLPMHIVRHIGRIIQSRLVLPKTKITCLPRN